MDWLDGKLQVDDDLLMLGVCGKLTGRSEISRCPSIPCYVSAQDECLWTDWVTEKNINGRQAKHYACIKRSDGSCAWYRGVAPPKQEFLDIEDP
uniref:Metalloproteinase inhibitor 2 n=1 Tax=Sphaerodactylus townsendi TaxID=933632 RepID=A0ACB8EKW3_9SAUR